jgi:sulfur-carrier protein
MEKLAEEEVSMPKVKIPTPFRHYTGGNSEVEVGGATAGETVGNLAETYPALEQYLYTRDGRLHPSINVYRGDEDIRHLDGPDTEVSEGDVLSIIPSIAGGSAERRDD